MPPNQESHYLQLIIIQLCYIYEQKFYYKIKVLQLHIYVFGFFIVLPWFQRKTIYLPKKLQYFEKEVF